MFVLILVSLGFVQTGCGIIEGVSTESREAESPIEVPENPRVERMEPPTPAPATPTPIFQLEGNTARVETLTIGPGFRPDPIRKTAQFVAPTLSATTLAPDCRGMTLPEPDFILDAQHTFAELHVSLVSEASATLIVVGPDGGIHCYGDQDTQPVDVSTTFQAGRHRIWVALLGVQGGAEDGPTGYTLSVSELELSH